jgi:hypothetical protein
LEGWVKRWWPVWRCPGPKQRFKLFLHRWGIPHAWWVRWGSTLGGATFPLLDTSSTATTPWAHGTTANPLLDADSSTLRMPWGGYQANMVLNVTDYVMFYGGAIWVPVGTFTWSVNAEIVWFGGGVQIFNVAGPSHTQFTPGSTWPSWSGNAGNYLTWQTNWCVGSGQTSPFGRSELRAGLNPGPAERGTRGAWRRFGISWRASRARGPSPGLAPPTPQRQQPRSR